MTTDPVTAIAALLGQVFGWAVDPTGFEQMKLEYQLEILAAGIRIAILKKDYPTLDVLFTEYRRLSKRVGT